jgi:ABC-type antimicrobial peptide transport system permease subunit
MKNLKGAISPKMEDDSSTEYFYSLGMFLVILGLILFIGSFLLFFVAIANSGFTYSEGQIYLSPQVFIFILFMSVVFIATGTVLMFISKKLKAKRKRKIKRTADTIH